MTLCSSVFSISVFNFEQVKSRLGSKSQRSKKRWYSSFILRKKPSQLRTCDTSKTVIFCENSLQFFRETVTILTRSSIFRSFTWCKICLGYFFRFTFIIDLIILLLTFLNITGTSTLLTNVCLTRETPQLYLPRRLDVLVNFGQIFFLVHLLLTLNIICLLWIPYDISLWKTKKGLYLWE